MKIVTAMQLFMRALRGQPDWRIKYGGRPRPRHYVAEGGPFNGKLLVLVDGTTASLRIGNVRGKYRCGLVASRDGCGTTKWIAS